MSKKEVVVAQEQQPIAIQDMVIDEETIKNYFCKNATSSELALGAMICKQQGLNPFTGDVHFVKYGEQKMQVIVSKYAFLKRAERNPNYDGFKAWVEADGDDFVGKCEVYRKDRKMPIYSEVYLSEYNQGNKMWKEKPKTMIRKVAVVQALREAFADELGGLLSEEEMSDEHITTAKAILPKPSIETLAQEIANAQTVEELEDWYKANKQFVDKDVLELLKQRKEALLETVEAEVVDENI